MYDSELMMAIIVASTAFAGLTVVVIGQVIRLTAVSETTDAKLKQIKHYLTWSFLTGTIVVLLAICWFIFNSPSSNLIILKYITIIAFLGQVDSLWAIAFRFRAIA